MLSTVTGRSEAKKKSAESSSDSGCSEPDRFPVRHEFMAVHPDPCPDLLHLVFRQVSLAEVAVGQGDDRLLSLPGRVKMRDTVGVMVQVQDDILIECH